jgi:putative tryptophan/tyrosine transport system substrate-binding protein
MRRRAFLTWLCGAAALPLAARAQQRDQVRRIGWLSSGSSPSAATRGFFQAMRERGYIEGQNLLVEYRWAGGNSERLAELAADLVSAGVDLIVTAGTPATLAAKQATSSIPIVFAVAGAPVQKGLVGSLANPGGNVTGLALLTDDLKALQILKEVAPAVTRVAFLYDPDTLPGDFGEDWLKRTRARSRALKLDFQPVALRSPDRTTQAFDTLPAGTNALLISNSSTNAQARRQICTLATQRRLPTASIERAFVDAGCLMTYGEDQVDMHRRAAGYADRIFKGAKPAELPVEQPTRFQLVINLKAANAIGLAVPPLMLTRADEVIE